MERTTHPHLLIRKLKNSLISSLLVEKNKPCMRSIETAAPGSIGMVRTMQKLLILDAILEKRRGDSEAATQLW
jgi:hypothetical protein